jgi:hypothetical protein
MIGKVVSQGGSGVKVAIIELPTSSSIIPYELTELKKIYAFIWRRKGSTSLGVGLHSLDGGTTWKLDTTGGTPTFPISAGDFCRLQSLSGTTITYDSATVIPEFVAIGE